MEELAREYKKRGVEFLLVYILEPHPGERGYEDIVQPQTYHQRMKLAGDTVKDCGIQRKTVLDTMDNDFYMSYGGCPNMVYIIGPDGVIVYHDRWASHEDVAHFLDQTIPNKKSP